MQTSGRVGYDARVNLRRYSHLPRLIPQAVYPTKLRYVIVNCRKKRHGLCMFGACTFCRKFALNGFGSEPYDRVLFESPNFVAVPTLGSILPGWLLIVPREHFLCIGAFTSELMRELIDFREEVASALCAAFGPIAFFEHGPASPCSLIGCGVDHAHLHLVPTTLELRAGADRISSGALPWTNLDQLTTLSRYHAEGLPYLYLHQFGESWICSPDVIESQLFRKVIATAVGQPQNFDWKRHSFLSSIEETVLRLEHVNRAATASSALTCVR